MPEILHSPSTVVQFELSPNPHHEHTGHKKGEILKETNLAGNNCTIAQVYRILTAFHCYFCIIIIFLVFGLYSTQNDMKVWCGDFDVCFSPWFAPENYLKGSGVNIQERCCGTTDSIRPDNTLCRNPLLCQNETGWSTILNLPLHKRQASAVGLLNYHPCSIKK